MLRPPRCQSCTNLLQTIHLAQLPLSWQERAEADAAAGGEASSDDLAAPVWDVERGSLPLLFAGGPAATSNPEPYADFLDFFALGDGEECLPEIGACLQAAAALRLSRRGTLLRLAQQVKGVYVPQFYQQAPGWGGAVFPIVDGVPARIQRRVAPPDPLAQAGRTLVPYVATVHDRLSVEIRRGCTRGCRFCQPGMLTRPARDVPPEEVIAAAEAGVRSTGYTDFSLLSLSCSDYLALPSVGLELRTRLQSLNISLQLPSQRVDRFDESIGSIMGGAAAQPSITFAPEAGSQRLRDVINKGLTDAELHRGVLSAYDQGWRRLKLYFMIGLPGETDEDVAGIAETIVRLQRACAERARASGARGALAITATISNFTPKPHTPFQWHSVSSSEFERKQALLRRALRGGGGGRRTPPRDVKLNFTPHRISAMEDFLGRGDRRLGAVVRAAWERGACNEAWWEGSDQAFAAWDGAIAASGLGWKYRQTADGEWDVLERVGDAAMRGQGGGGRGRLDRGAAAEARLDAPLPWDHIDTGISRSWLKADLQRALEAAAVEDCSHGACSECGVCGDEFGHNVVAPPPPPPAARPRRAPGAPPPPEPSVRAQRLRLRMAKRGPATAVGHLDTMRLLERACRRAALPVSLDESPFHARPRLTTALALGLGCSSEGELLELQLTRRLPPPEVARRLQEQLPAGFVVEAVAEHPFRDRAGAGRMLSLGGAVDAVEWLLLLGTEEGEVVAGGPPDWAALVGQLLAQPRCEVAKRTKGGRETMLDLRPALLQLRLADDRERARLLAFASGHLGAEAEAAGAQAAPEGAAALHLLGGAGVDESGQGLFNPEHLLGLLSGLAGRPLRLLHCHRLGVRTRDAALPAAEGGPLTEEEAVEVALAAARELETAAQAAERKAAAAPELAAV